MGYFERFDGSVGSTNLTITDATGNNNSLKINPQVNKSASTSVGGAILIDNSSSTGAGMVIYSTQAAPVGRLLALRVNNSSFNQAAMSVDYIGNGHAATINHTGTGSTALAFSIVSTNVDDTALGVTGSPYARGTIKVTHNYPGSADANASLISGLINGGGTTACQGFFIDVAGGSTTGKLINFRQNGVEKFVVDPNGNIQISGNQVLGPRITGWGSATGTKARTTFVTDSVTLPQLAARVGQLIDDLISHGSIGA